MRDLYPPSSKYARRGVGLDGRKRGRSKPTDARPGSKSKLRALIRRAASGKPLFLAADRQFPIADPRDEGRIGGSHNGAVPQRGKRKL